jgi:hypothetical protein
MTKTTNKKPTWKDLKHHLADLDHTALLGLVHDLYAAGKDNQSFLHTRFGLGDDVLKPYKTAISRWASPDVMRNQDYSVSKAKKAISDYKKAIGRPEGLAELSVFYCEACTDFLGYCSTDDEVYFNALVRMFEQALMVVGQLEPDQKEQFVDRLESVRHESSDWGWGVEGDMDDLMAEYGFGEE